MGCDDVQNPCLSSLLLSGSGIHCWGPPNFLRGTGRIPLALSLSGRWAKRLKDTGPAFKQGG